MTTTTPALPLPSRLLDSRVLPPTLFGTTSTARMHGKPATAGDAPIVLGEPGGCPPQGSLVHVVLDQSPSVTSDGGTDPLSRRHAEAALAIRHVAAACRCRRDRVALAPFDAESAGAVAPQPLTRRGLRTLDHGLQQLADTWGMSSRLGPALDRVEAEKTDSGVLRAVVVFSDFLLTDPNPSSVLRRLCELPGYVHAVVLGAQPPTVLLADPHVAVTRLTPSSPAGSAARAVFDGLTRFRTHTHDPGSAAHPHENLGSEGELIA
ncbi:hypothetical protein SBI67_01130 [Mycolicibacterium sp. 120266]|uniref:hypothetical protein n=1 Tax=Mycolicibacterium sp. 120266 TaxID=3090601 RepID=UPI00299EE1E5|nr:hypothetical protein [Mycolicibacterium sp. 120266]MDX1870711.1 hypothetical protein [Mycolicibacterium sp. 120266]